MATLDTCCTINPYFKVAAGKLARFRELAEQCVAQTQSEPKCLYYGFSYDGDTAFCREGYVDADGLLHHLGNVGAILKEVFTIAELVRLEVHGPATELAQLRTPLAQLNPQFFTLESGFRH
jgi:quinol monooxygenase YgiN